MFWSIKYIHNREYKMYWQNQKIAKWWVLSIFLRKEGLNKYIKLLCEMKLWDKLRRCSVKKVFLEIYKLCLKTPVLKSFLNKVAGLTPVTLLKRDSNTSVFRWILCNFLRTPFLQNPSGRCFFIKDLFLSIFSNKKSFKQIFSNLLV